MSDVSTSHVNNIELDVFEELVAAHSFPIFQYLSVDDNSINSIIVQQFNAKLSHNSTKQANMAQV